MAEQTEMCENLPEGIGTGHGGDWQPAWDDPVSKVPRGQSLEFGMADGGVEPGAVLGGMGEPAQGTRVWEIRDPGSKGKSKLGR